jgi:hypothetical protein
LRFEELQKLLDSNKKGEEEVDEARFYGRIYELDLPHKQRRGEWRVERI